jgi:hypothetical protein
MEIHLMRPVRTLALAGAASLLLFGSLGVTAAAADPVEPSVTDTPAADITPAVTPDDPGSTAGPTVAADPGPTVPSAPDAPSAPAAPDDAPAAPDAPTAPAAPAAPAGDDTVASTPPAVEPGTDSILLSPVVAPDPVAPEVIDVPMVTGTARYGETLHVSNGTWSGTPTITFTYQWQQCGDDDCTDIAGATAADYTLVVGDIGHHVSATVTATNDAGETSEPSDNWSDIVEGINPTGPAPTISGLPRVGETLTASVGEWTGEGPLTTTWRWASCGGLYACSEIEGANSPTYTITPDNLGDIIVARVDFTSALGSDGAPSEPTGPVVAALSAGHDSNVASDGKTITVSGSGFLPDSDVTVVLHSDPVVLGVAHTDANGNFTATFALPAGVPAGEHTLIFTGLDAFGNPVTVEQTVTLAGTGPPSVPASIGMLPVTGMETLYLTLLAAGLLITGAGTLVVARRQTLPVK